VAATRQASGHTAATAMESGNADAAKAQQNKIERTI
jgi:hypothetical protein